MADPRYDIYIHIKDASDVTRGRAFSYGDGEAQKSKGFYKSTLMWLKCLLTTRGTDVSDRTYGTLLPAIMDGGVTDRSSIGDIVAVSVGQATSKIRAYQAEYGASSEEKIKDAYIEYINHISDDAIELKILLKNASGETMEVRLPLDIV